MVGASAASGFNIQFFDEQRALKNKGDGKRHVVGYARLSYDEDGTGYCSIVNQIDILNEYYNDTFDAGESDLTMIYDDNVSGYKFEREGLFRVFDLIVNGRCDVILAKDLSRIGRHSALTQLFVESCERVGVRIIALDDYDSHKESDDIILGIKAWSNERVVKDTSAKIIKVIRHKQENGTWFCAAPFGYIVNDYATADISIDEEAAEIVRRIFSMYLNGNGINKIARTLMDEGVMTPSMRARELSLQRGKPYRKKVTDTWNPGQLSKLLGDEFYVGRLVTGRYKRRGINGQDVRTERSEQKVFADNHEAIIPQEMFDAVQRVRKIRAAEAYRPGKNGETLFHGLLFCGDCGNKLYTYKNQKIQRQYICSRYFRHLGCTRHTIKEETLVQITLHVLEAIKKQFPEVVASLDKELAAEKRRMSEGLRGSSELTAELHKLEHELEIIEEQRIKQIIAHPEREDFLNRTYDRMAAQTRENIAKLKTSIEELAARESDLSLSRKSESLSSAMKAIDSIIESRDIRRKDVELLFKRITVYEDGRVIVDLNPDLEGALQDDLVLKTRRRSRGRRDAEGAELDINVIREGDPLEIFTDHDGEVVLKKYSPIGEIAAVAKDYTDSLYRTLGHMACICDRDAVVSLSGASKKELVERPLSPEMEELLQGRRLVVNNLSEGARMVAVTNDDSADAYTAQIIMPILSDGEIIGGILLLSRNAGARMSDVDQKVAETTATIIGRQMEQ